MKKYVCFTLALFFAVAMASAASYSWKNNTYQKLAEEYTRKAERALDAGEYELSVEYARKAEENAALSEEFIKHLLARGNVDELMDRARRRLEYAKSIHADENYPIAYNAAADYYRRAQEAYDKEDYDNAAALAIKVAQTLAQIKEMTPLPKFYIVQPWDATRDCFWNISGRPYVYNNPFLWENLYEANRSSLPQPNNPNLILPGMKMEIPSISGEYRDGTYSPDADYGTYDPANYR